MALTWKDVAAPDYTGAQQGFASFSNLLGNALGGANKALGEFDAGISDRVNNELALRINQYTDPDKLKADMDSGEFFKGINTKRLSQDNLRLIGERPNQLLRTKQLTNEITQADWEFKNKVMDEDSRNAAAPILGQVLTRLSNNDRKGAQDLLDAPESQAIIGKMDLGDLYKLFENKGSVLDRALGVRAADQTYEKTAYDHKRTVMNDQDTDTFKQVAAGLVKRAITPQLYRDIRLKTGELSGYSPAVLLALDEKFGLTQDIGPAPGGSGSSGDGTGGIVPGAGGSSDPVNLLNYEAQEKGYTSLPENVKTLGDVSEFALKLNREGIASSAAGIFQIVGSNIRGWKQKDGSLSVGYAQRVFGNDWKKVAWNADTQDRIAEAIFNDYKHDPAALKKQWVSLSLTEATRISKLPWQQARQVIGQLESGADLSGPDQRGQTDKVLGKFADNKISQPDLAFARQYRQLSEDPNSTKVTAEVAAAELAKTDQLKGAYLPKLTEQLKNVMKKFGVSAPIAALYMRSSIGEADATGWMGVGSDKVWGTANAGVNMSQMKAWDKKVKNTSETGLLALASAFPSIERSEAAVKAAGERLIVAEKNLAAARAQRAAGFDVSMGDAILEYNSAKAAKQAADDAAMGDETLTGKRAPPPKVAGPAGAVPLRRSPEGDAVLDRYVQGRGGKPGPAPRSRNWNAFLPGEPAYNSTEQEDLWAKMGGKPSR